MRHILIFILFFMAGLKEAGAQRYVERVFDEVERQTVTYSKGDQHNLEMDIYQPRKDTEKLRPVLVYVHGGGFSGGRRDEPKIISFCEDMARRGLVVVSMSYTLTMKGKSFGCDQDAGNKLATFKQAGNEIGAATAYLLKHQNKLKIDPSLIILSGSSAGAEAVIHAAYWPETRTTLAHDFNYAGVISMAGALFDVNLVTRESAIPTQLFHGTCDNLVPYGKAAHHYCSENDDGYLMLYGGQSIAERLEQLNTGFYLVTGCNGGHEWNDLPMAEYKDEIADFIFYDVLQNEERQIHEVVESDKTCALAIEIQDCIIND